MKKQTKQPFKRFTHLRFINFILLFALIGTLFLHFTLAASAGYHYPDEATLVHYTNSRRGANGQNGLYWSGCLSNAAREHARTMASTQSLYHSDYTNLITRHCGGWGQSAGENVGRSGSVNEVWSGPNGFLNSGTHRANIDGSWTHTAVGVWRQADGYMYVTQLFVRAASGYPGYFNQAVDANPQPAYSSANAVSVPPPPASGTRHYLRNSNTSGNNDVPVFNFGNPGDIPIYCDWNGDRKDTVGIFRKGVFHMSDTNGVTHYTAGFGNPDDIPICGDWNGDGKDTIGVYRKSNATFYLRNSNNSGGADLTVRFGDPGDRPLVGDWDGNGTDTIGIRRGSVYYLRNTNSSGNANLNFAYGDPSDIPVAGDWNNDGKDTPGIRRGGIFYLRNSNSTGIADLTVSYGSSTDIPVVGDWDGNGTTTIGIVRP